MPRFLAFALISAGFLSACGPPPAPIQGGVHSQSVGFTGVGGFREFSAPATSTLVSSTSQTYAATPGRGTVTGLTMIKVTTGRTSRSDIAKVAIQRGARVNAPSTPININGQTLAFSLVEVNGRRFAVLNKQVGFSGAGMNSGTRTAFAAQVPQLTGCVAEGAGYGYGQNRNAPIGIAIPLVCG